MDDGHSHAIPSGQARSLAGLFAERVRRTPHGIAYRYCDTQSQAWRDVSWAQAAVEVRRWQQALLGEGLQAGERIAMMLPNGCRWVYLDQAALGLGLAVVPLYVNDRPDNIAQILAETGTRLVVLEGGERWNALRQALEGCPALRRIVAVGPVETDDPRVAALGAWLPEAGGEIPRREIAPDALATIVYTSGTAGRPKGVMLSHRNILSNAAACLVRYPVFPQDLFLSFLPLSHSLERTVGYYLPMMAGATVAYARSIPQLADDLREIRPTVMISVPRIYERVYARILAQLDEQPLVMRRLFWAAVASGWRSFLYRQKRAGWHPALWVWPLLERLVAAKVVARFGGRLRVAVCGGAPLPPEIARLFIGLGLPLVHGYGMTETSPVISANLLEDNEPESVGEPLPGVEVGIGAQDELLVKGPGVMLGYWEQPQATAEVIDRQGWLHTGDKARISAGRIYITGRLKEIIVLSNGEKVPPADMETAIMADPLCEQVMVCGEGRPYLTALVVLNAETWAKLAPQLGARADDPAALGKPAVADAVCRRIGERLHGFPGYAQIRRVALDLEPWTVENGLLTPTLKLRRGRIKDHYGDVIAGLYAGHS